MQIRLKQPSSLHRPLVQLRIFSPPFGLGLVVLVVVLVVLVLLLRLLLLMLVLVGLLLLVLLLVLLLLLLLVLLLVLVLVLLLLLLLLSSLWRRFVRCVVRSVIVVAGKFAPILACGLAAELRNSQPQSVLRFCVLGGQGFFWVD